MESINLTATAGSIAAIASNSRATTATASAATSIDFAQTGNANLTIASFTTTDGDIFVSADRNLTANSVVAGGDGNITLTSRDAAISIDVVTALGNKVTLNAAGNILGSDLGDLVSAADLDVTSKGTVSLNTSVDTLTSNVTRT